MITYILEEHGRKNNSEKEGGGRAVHRTALINLLSISFLVVSLIPEYE